MLVVTGSRNLSCNGCSYSQALSYNYEHDNIKTTILKNEMLYDVKSLRLYA